MQRELILSICQMDKKNVETQLALQCAPLIAHLKLANLLIIRKGSRKRLWQLIQESGISCYTLLEGEEKLTLLLYWKEGLQEYLSDGRMACLLKKMGYHNLSLDAMLPLFQIRYAHYMNDRMLFPHEMGLFLGYPVEDVEGYIRYRGKYYLYNGYWKVYANLSAKKELFKAYEVARSDMVRCVSLGIPMEQVLRDFSVDRTKKVFYNIPHGGILMNGGNNGKTKLP